MNDFKNLDKNVIDSIEHTINILANEETNTLFKKNPKNQKYLPSVKILQSIMNKIQEIIFPGFFEDTKSKFKTIKNQTGFILEDLSELLYEQIKKGFCFSCTNFEEDFYLSCQYKSKTIVSQFIQTLPKIRFFLNSDVLAAYNGDPAAENIEEIIFCYPSLLALTYQRVAHELYLLKVPIIPRIISEIAHSKTGIDIHPGASIDTGFFIDHGTGTVIGETCIIGKNVKIYQGVTLGAKNFPKDKDGNLLKKTARHPIVEDNVIIYAGTSILGNITIGKNSIIGSNLWISESIPQNTKMIKEKKEIN